MSQYNLLERTEVLGVQTILLLRRVKKDVLTKPLLHQLVRAVTSVGANYCEADNAVSRKEFLYKIGICRKEAKEAAFFFTMLTNATADRRLLPEISKLKQEAIELHRIFTAIYRKTSVNNS